jgi:hypothetical protein
MKKFRSVILVCLFSQLFFSSMLLGDPPSAPNPPSPGGSPGGASQPVGAPVDRNVFILVLLGAGYGIKKLLSKHSNPVTEQA